MLKYWKPDTFEISSYYGDSLERRRNLKTDKSTNDTSGLCTYTYNSLGFRGDEPTKNGFKIMSIGCSYTEGVGVNDNETWPHQFAKLVPNGVDLNFGCAARSNDYIVRCLFTFYDIANPDLVLIHYTHSHRREYYTDKNNIEPYMPTSTWDYMENDKTGKRIHTSLTYLQNDNEDFINWYKNHQLIKLFLESKKCNWVWIGPDVPLDYIDKNRFIGNFEKVEDWAVDNIHAGPKTNKSYAHNLFNYILKNHSNFFPKELNNLAKLI